MEKVKNLPLNITKLIAIFPYEQVEKTMKSLNWKWHEKSIPHRTEMVKTVVELFQNLLKSGKETISTGTGGFYVYRYKDEFGNEEFGMNFKVAERTTEWVY